MLQYDVMKLLLEQDHIPCSTPHIHIKAGIIGRQLTKIKVINRKVFITKYKETHMTHRMLWLPTALQQFSCCSDVTFLQRCTCRIACSSPLTHALAGNHTDEQRQQVWMSKSCSQLRC